MDKPQPQKATNKTRRKRPRRAQIRQDLRKVLESAILAPKSKILSFFTKKDSIYSGNLFLILQKINPSQLQSFFTLNTFAFKSLNNRSRVFTITGPNDAKPQDLKIEFSTKLRAQIMDTIAYVDNLPLLCTPEKLTRRAAIFGRVIDVYLPPPRRVAQKHLILKGSKKVVHSGYGFVQFTTSHAVKRFCRKYAANSHLRRHSRKPRRKRTRSIKSQLQANSQGEPIDPENPTTTNLTYEETNSYQFEWSGLESGLESDYEFASKRSKMVSFDLSYVSSSKEENATDIMGDQGSKMTTKVKKTRRKRSLIGQAVSLKYLFRGIQVFPYRTYRKLKKEYYSLKRQVRQAYAIEYDTHRRTNASIDVAVQ